MKYNCPNSSTWKLAIESFFRILKVGLVIARKHRRNLIISFFCDLQLWILGHAFESMWTELAKTFDDFLFSKRYFLDF
jgi:hypothetical protein